MLGEMEGVPSPSEAVQSSELDTHGIGTVLAQAALVSSAKD